MCLILIAWQAHPDYRLVVAANRDEFYARPSTPLSRWNDAPHVMGGRDRAEVIGLSGTWMGLTDSGRFAAITNVRAPTEKRIDTRSRGELTAHYLLGDAEPFNYIADLQRRSDAYNGFNLLVGDHRELWWYNNRSDRLPQALMPGIYGVSNAELDTPWPKLRHRAAAFAETLAADRGENLEICYGIDAYLDLLADERLAADFELPKTGVSPEWEKLLSAAFIRRPNYGTRASTVLRVRRDGHYDFSERSFDAQGVIGERHLRGRLEARASGAAMSGL